MVLIKLLIALINIYIWIIVIQAVLSWVIRDPYNRMMLALRRMTDPVYEPIRKLLKLENMGVDPTPLIVIIVLLLLQAVLKSMVVGF